jgi:ABC-type nitrate/sulfonate/bicarbonate transport system substrate-binding protein
VHATELAAAVIAVIGLAAIFLPPGSGSRAPARAAPPEQPDPAVAVVPAADSAGFFVALHEGLFAGTGCTTARRLTGS